MSETAERKNIERIACYILDLPPSATFTHSKVVNGDLRKYYYISDEDGARYVYTSEKDQAFNKKMMEAARRHRSRYEA
jgi:capsular polysaccharide biosynthesis protein